MAFTILNEKLKFNYQGSVKMVQLIDMVDKISIPYGKLIDQFSHKRLT